MKTISLPDSELKTLIRHYEEEYELTQKRLDEIANIINNLKDGINEREPVKLKESKVQKPEADVKIQKVSDEDENKVVEAISEDDLEAVFAEVGNNPRKNNKTKKKAAKKKKAKEMKPPELANFDLSKLDWRNFLLSKIQSQNEVVNAEILIELATQAYGLYHFDKLEVEKFIIKELDKLVAEEYLQCAEMDEPAGKYYGYTPWFNQQKRPKDEYKPTLKLEDIKPKEEKEPEKEEARDSGKSKLELGTEKFILDSLKSLRKLLIVSDLVSLSRNFDDFSGLNDSQREELFDRMLREMYTEEQLGRIKVSNSDEFQYALPKWFKNDGGLKVYYKAR